MKPSIRYLIGLPVSTFVLVFALSWTPEVAKSQQSAPTDRKRYEIDTKQAVDLGPEIAGMRTPPTPEARQALAPTGKLRVGLVLGSPIHVIRESASGEMKGMGHDLGMELARRMGIPFEPVLYPSLRVLLAGSKSGDWDVAFFLINPARMKNFDFTAPVLELELGYLVPKGSTISTSVDVDQPGIRVAFQGKSTVDAILSRTLKNAILIRGPLTAGLEMLKSEKADVYASNKANLFAMSDQLPGSRVLDERFAAERVAMATPKGRLTGVTFARKFIEDAKSEGLVKAAVERAGARGVVLVPPQ